LKDTKSTYETKLSTMREDIYKKEREIYDLKNQINLINLRISKESESRLSVESALKKHNEKFFSDTTKFDSSIKEYSKDNETLALKYQEIERTLQQSTIEKREFELRLSTKVKEFEESKTKFQSELEEKNKRIA